MEIYLLNLPTSAVEAHRLLAEAYGECALSEKSSCEWFLKFRDGEFEVETKDVVAGGKCMKTRRCKHYCRMIRAKRNQDFHFH